MTQTKILFALTLGCCLAAAQQAGAQTIPIYALAKAPTVDGDAGDWTAVPYSIVDLRKTRPDGTTEVSEVALKGGTHGDRAYFLVEWRDSTEDTLHKPWVWDVAADKYVTGPQREDRFALQFAIDGDYTTDWRSGSALRADTWHWKASRSNPLGLAHDKSLVISREKLLRAYRLPLPDGGHVYVARPSDAGDRLYRTKRYRRLDQTLVPKYLLTEGPTGSVADVRAKGAWRDGRWQLELSRKLDTGHADDVVLPKTADRILGGLAVFQQSENDDHAISATLTFDFLHRPAPVR